MLTQATQTDYGALYRRAFADYKSLALWNIRYLVAPGPEDALVIARALRVEGKMQARFLAEEIEEACCAAV